MKRLLTLFLLMYMSLNAMASETSVKNADGVDIWYDFDSSTKTAAVTYGGFFYGYYSDVYSGEVVIPSTVTYEGVEYCVTSIGNNAFYYCDALTSITLPEGVTSIGNYAFNGCDALTSITLPDGVTSIGKSAFSGCEALTSLTLPESLTSIGVEAFEFCSSLTSITIPDCVTSIGDYTFYGCSALTSITLPKSVTSIGYYAFSDCSALTSITLPDGVTSIGYCAFSDCSALTSITLPESLTSIGNSAFSNCCRLYEVYNKSNLTITAGSWNNGYVAYYAKNVYSEGESKLKTVGDYIFYIDGEDIELIAYTGNEISITLPSDYEGKNYNIGDYAFRECDALTSITLPEGVTSIGDYAFYECDALTSITLPESLTSIGNSAFYECDALTSITLPEGLTSIEDYAFGYCYSFTSITLPESLTSIGFDAFYNCCRLYEVYNKSDLTITAGDWYNGYVAYYAKNVYTDIEGESKLKTVGDYIFYVDGEDIELIAYTGSETSITLPSDYEGKNYNIGDYALYGCDSLTSITLPEGVTTIGDYAFEDCYSLTSITLPESLTSIGNSAFYYCSSLTSITIPEGVTSIGDDAFSRCYALTSITLPEGVTSIGKDAFRSCTALTSITLPEGVTSIGDYAFYNCSALTSITLPEGVTSIGKDAFAYCSALTSITSKNTTPPTIGGSYTFDDVDKSIPVYVPKSSVDAYKSAEYWKDFTNFIGGTYFVDVTSENGTVEGAGAYEENAEVTLKATPAEGYKFVKWSDGVTDNPRIVVVTSDTTFTADIQKGWTIYATAENGDISGVGVYLEGDEATVTATPNEGYKFVKWSDGVTDNPRTIVVVSDTTFTAVFELKEYTLTIEAENGTVEGAGTYKHGDEATLTATPIVGYIFTKWSDGVTDNPRTVVVVSDTTLTAEFEIDNTPISDIQTSDVKVRLVGNEIVVEGADDYTVYSISGQSLGKVESVERGIYIVVVNGKSYKVIAK